MIESSPIASFPTEIIKEGSCKFLVPELKAFIKSPSDYAPSKAPVFYNPVMELNRDIAVLALQAYQRMIAHDIHVCEPLASGGLRGIRFAAEVRGVRKVLMNDISKNAFQIAKHNVQLNKLKKNVTVKNEDANLLLSRHGAPRKRFDAIDVDPFGSPVFYVDSAIRALRNHGLIALTATDMAPLCGVYPKACIRKYGGKPLRTEYCHELAIRLLIGCLATMSAKREIGVHVAFSHSANHYIRAYAVIEYGARNADETLKNMGYILHCFKCLHRESSRLFDVGHSGLCNECGSKLSIGGPLWLGGLFDNGFCELMEEEAKQKELTHRKRILKIIGLARTEADASIGYFVVDKLSDSMNLPVPSIKQVVDALRQDGFLASPTSLNPKGIRSNAPAKKMKEALRKAIGSKK